MHYFGPLGLAIVCQIALTAGAAHVRRGSRDYDPWITLRLLPFVLAVVFLHFNFKGWAPLVNPRMYDSLYETIDQVLSPVVGAFAAIRSSVASASPVAVDSAYHELFVLAFFVSYTAHAVLDKPIGIRRVIFATSLVLLAGGVLYWIAPAVGPFIYGPGPNALASRSQEIMWRVREQLIQTRQFPPGAFTAGLAAMPSLHVANMLVFVIYANRLRWLWLAYFPLLAWIVIEAVVSRYHYVIDLPAGAILALACVQVSNRLLPQSTAGGVPGQLRPKDVPAGTSPDTSRRPRAERLQSRPAGGST
ncbi:MAG: phosphatase PAP2 family protein [bacterium]